MTSTTFLAPNICGDLTGLLNSLNIHPNSANLAVNSNAEDPVRVLNLYSEASIQLEKYKAEVELLRSENSKLSSTIDTHGQSFLAQIDDLTIHNRQLLTENDELRRDFRDAGLVDRLRGDITGLKDEKVTLISQYEQFIAQLNTSLENRETDVEDLLKSVEVEREKTASFERHCESAIESAKINFEVLQKKLEDRIEILERDNEKHNKLLATKAVELRNAERKFATDKAQLSKDYDEKVTLLDGEIQRLNGELEIVKAECGAYKNQYLGLVGGG